jgi:DNA-binding MarR family transcriptional regulator
VIGTGDRRARMVRLTPRGKIYWSEILLRIYQFYDQAAANFTFDERVALVHFLNELQKDLLTVTLPQSELPKRGAKR